MNSFEELIKYNEKLFQLFTQRPFFLMIKENSELSLIKRQRFLNCVQVFSNEFQKVMFARQASCVDKKYLPTFTKHFEEELGHDDLLMQRKNIKTEKDAVLTASSSWFVWQMFVRDNIEKVVLVHLVLELSGDFYHELAKEHFEGDVDSDFFSIHAEADEFHANMGVDLLVDLSDENYKQLKDVVKQSWQMLTVMVDRTYKIVNTTEAT